jgi:hypothetical protein
VREAPRSSVNERHQGRACEEQDDRADEYRLVTYYGVALGYPLVWAVEGANQVPELLAWFPTYESWGCR